MNLSPSVPMSISTCVSDRPTITASDSKNLFPVGPRKTSFFPKNVPVGTIQNYELQEGSNFYDISLSLSTDFGSLDYVYIVNYILKEEQLELEADQVEADDE